MRILKRSLCASLLVSLLAACGSGATTATLVPIPSVTPLSAADSPTTGAAGKPTATAAGDAPAPAGDPSADIQQGQEALAAGNYEDAIEFLNPVYNADNQNTEVATLLAQAYDAWGVSILKAAPAASEATREAFEKFNRAEAITEAESATKDTVSKHKQASEALLKGLSALDQFDGMVEKETALAGGQAQVEIAQASVTTMKELDSSFAGLREFNYRMLLAAATFKELTAAEKEDREDRLPLWEEAKAHCTEAKDLWPDDEVAAADALECLERVANKIKPPATPTPAATETPLPKPTAAPKPTAKPPVGPSKVRFAPVIQVGYQASDETGARDSCVLGKVVLADGTPVGGAAGNVNNGSASLDWVTDGGGSFGICGLGWSNWSAVLFYIPPSYGEISGAVAIPGLWLNGAGDQKAVVVFQGR